MTLCTLWFTHVQNTLFSYSLAADLNSRLFLTWLRHLMKCDVMKPEEALTKFAAAEASSSYLFSDVKERVRHQSDDSGVTSIGSFES